MIHRENIETFPRFGLARLCLAGCWLCGGRRSKWSEAFLQLLTQSWTLRELYNYEILTTHLYYTSRHFYIIRVVCLLYVWINLILLRRRISQYLTNIAFTKCRWKFNDLTYVWFPILGSISFYITIEDYFKLLWSLLVSCSVEIISQGMTKICHIFDIQCPERSFSITIIRFSKINVISASESRSYSWKNYFTTFLKR